MVTAGRVCAGVGGLTGREGADEDHITYDRDADAIHIRLIEGNSQCHLVRLTDDIVLDFTAGDKLVGIEVSGASRLFGKPRCTPD